MVATYTDDWKEIATIVKENAHWQCANCGHHHDPGHGYTLTVHHINLDSMNNSRDNLVALCQKCHLHFQRPLNTFQTSFFPLPPWRSKSFKHGKAKSSGIKTSG